MTQTWTQYLTVAAEFSLGLPPASIRVQNLDTAGLLIEWDIALVNTPSSDTATVRITNLDEFTQIPTLEQRALDPSFFGTRASISFGWQGATSLAFEGAVTQILPRIQNGPDLVSQITFASLGGRAQAPIPLGAELDQANWLSVLQALAGAMGLQLSAQFKKALATNKVATTNPTLRACFNNDPKRDFGVIISSLGPGITWSVFSGEIFLLNQGLFQDQTPPQILSAETGLLKWTPLDNGGVSADALGNPSIRPGQQIILKDDQGLTIGGQPMRVESVSFSGATNAGCTMAVIARKLNLLL